MNKSNADIELIRKYFNGELSPADKYELEKRALDDPFLQDAMDGFEQFSVDQKVFDDLDNRLAERLKEKERVLPIWGFKNWSIAASLIIGIAAISIYLNQTPENKPIVVSEIQKKERLPQSVKILEDTIVNDEVIGLLESSPTIVQNDIPTSAEAQTNDLTLQSLSMMNEKAIKDSLMLNEVRVVGYGTQAKRDISGSVSRFNPEEASKLKSELALNSKASSVSALRIRDINTDQIIGKVVSNEDGSALPGVQIKNTQSGAVTTTNSDGEFKIQGNEKDQLTAIYIGYLTETVFANKNDSLKINLIADQSALSEVVVTKNRTKANNKSEAGPAGGWKSFREYLDKNAKLPNGEKGRVVVQFYIQPNGTLSDFSIQKSMNSLADSKAISLIKNYSSWFGASNGKALKINASVRFK